MGTMRSFSGSEQFDALKKTVVESYTKLFPVKNQSGYQFDLQKVWVDDSGLDTSDYTDQKKSKLAGSTWGAPVYASINLRDPSGKIVDHMDQVRLSTVPRLTPRGSYLVQGNEYQVSNQLRRKPGVYVVKRATGDQYKANFNLGGESSKNFELHFDPAAQKYTIQKIAGSQGSTPLYPLLHALGVSDQTLEKQWGADVLASNRVKNNNTDILRLAQKFTGVKTEDVGTATDALKTWTKGTKLDPQITELTLGKAHASLNGEAILAASKKLIGVYAGKEHPDDPENLLFKEVLSVEDMLSDWMNSKGKVSNMNYMLSRHLGKKMHIKDMIDFKKLSSPVESFFKHDDRVTIPEQHNPMQMVSNTHKLTLMGTGGIKNPHTVTNEIREVHPTHVGFIDPVHTPESQNIGTMLHLTAGLMKDGRDVRTRVVNTKTGKIELLTPMELFKKTVAFPDEASVKSGKVSFKTQEVRSQQNGKVKTSKPSDVDYVFASHSQLFSPSTNMIPFLSNDQGTRVMMGSKMLEQAIPLVEREAPLVQTNAGDGKTFQQLVGNQFAVRAPITGVVSAVTPDYIELNKKTRIPIYNNFPLNQKTFIHHESKVKPGDIVKEGDLLADSNYTKGGTLALGKNLKVAYLPYPGLTFEDGIVITESAAKKLATQQIYKHQFELTPGKNKTNLKLFHAYYPNAVGVKQLANYDSDGVIKKGTIIQPGQITIMGLNDAASSPENATLKRINKALQTPWSNASVKYSGEFPGVVTDVVKRAGKIEVYVKAEEVARASDKLSGVHGNKGVITRVIPDHEAPRTVDGKIPDVFLNPHGIISRINLGQLYESAASKIAQKTGKTYVVDNFNGEDTSKKVSAELAAHGLSDQEEFVLPNGKPIGKVTVGNPYILRLAKTGKTGFSARMPGTGYDLNMQPTKGGEEGTKNFDLMTFYSMLSHGAKKNLVDVHMKSEKNDELWHAIETGKTIPNPKPSFAWHKFMGLLRGAGVNPIKEGPNVTLAPMTDADVKKLSHGKIDEPEFLYGKDLKEKAGGFFDRAKTGGLLGTNYTHIEMNERMPNPVFEKAIRSLTNLSAGDFDAIVSGTKHVMANGAIGEKADKGSITGGAGIHRLLSQVDVPKQIIATRAELKTVGDKPAKLNQLSKKLRYLTALTELKLTPEEAYTRQLIPVIPPIHRPVYEMGNRGLQVAPANLLYQNVGILNKSHELPVMKLLDDEDKKELRQDTYKATRALAGLEPVIQKSRDQIPIEGFMTQIAGKNPKSGFFLQKVISKRQDLVGRGVITAAPDLDVDQIGVPEKMAWNVFRPFIIREYTQSGIPAITARKEIDEKSPRAKQMLESAMNKRTVLANRAPSLHKFSIMAFKPKLTQGLALGIPPLVLKGFGGDYDGDAMTLHIPISEEAVRESHKMFPSQNLFKPGTGELMIQPSQESAIGLYFLSQTKEGREKINNVLPSKFHVLEPLDAGKAKALYNKMAHEEPKTFSKYVSTLKHLGDKTAYEKGFSVGLKDIQNSRAIRDTVFSEADTQARAMKQKGGADVDSKVSDLYEAAAKKSFEGIEKGLKESGNNFYHMVSSGARGNKSQLMQMISAPGIMRDAKDRKIPVPIKKSYAEGLSTADYLISAYGVRKGMMDRALQTSAPGALNKDIMASTLDNLITVDDCGVKHGIVLPITSSDVHGRFLSHDQHGFHRNTLITPQIISELQKKGVKEINVRSPLRCVAPKGTCAQCYGIDEHDKVPEVGDNIGVRTGQAMSEPMTQMVMRTFHTGGVSSGAPTSVGFERVSQLLKMPEYVAGEAALSIVHGEVKHIKKLTSGGHEITVGNEIHKVRPGLAPTVKLGDHVEAGDKLTQGVIKPQNLVKYKGMQKAQDYVVDELHKAYQGQGIPLQRKTFETVVRSLGNLTKVVNSPKQSDFSEGDVIPYSTATHYNETRAEDRPASDSQGYHLAKSIGKLPQFHELGDKDVSYLKGLGYNNIKVLKDPLIHAPVLKGIERLPMEKKNWLAQVGYQRIKDTLTEGASQAWKSNVEGNHPIPAFAYGASFGKKKEHY